MPETNNNKNGISGREVGQLIESQKFLLERIEELQDMAQKRFAFVNSNDDKLVLRIDNLGTKIESFAESSQKDRSDLRQEINVMKTELKTGLLRVGDLLESEKEHDRKFISVTSEDARINTNIQNLEREIREAILRIERLESNKLDRSSLIIYVSIVGLIIAFASFLAGHFAL